MSRPCLLFYARGEEVSKRQAAYFPTEIILQSVLYLFFLRCSISTLPSSQGLFLDLSMLDSRGLHGREALVRPFATSERVVMYGCNWSKRPLQDWVTRGSCSCNPANYLHPTFCPILERHVNDTGLLTPSKENMAWKHRHILPLLVM